MIRVSGTFTVPEVVPQPFTPAVRTGLPVGHSLMRKEFRGGIQGWSQTQFVYAFDPGTNTGGYVALESYSGLVDGHEGCVNIAHAASMVAGAERSHELVVIVPGSGTGALRGMSGTGSIVIEPDGTHHLVLD